jgi:hypothetical protein
MYVFVGDWPSSWYIYIHTYIHTGSIAKKVTYLDRALLFKDDTFFHVPDDFAVCVCYMCVYVYIHHTCALFSTFQTTLLYVYGCIYTTCVCIYIHHTCHAPEDFVVCICGTVCVCENGTMNLACVVCVNGTMNLTCVVCENGTMNLTCVVCVSV